MTDFSVVIPLYNAAAHIGATLDAVLAQTRPAAEVIVVDDGSTDAGPAIVAGYRDRVTLLRQEQNRGVQAARNRGIGAATGAWIALCDADDLWAPDYLARQAALLASVPRLEFTFANFRRLVDGAPEGFTKFDQAPAGFWEEAGRRVLAEGWVFDRPIAGLTFVWHPIFPSATVLARELVAAVGGFDPALRGLRPEDGEFTLRCLYRAAVGALPDPLVTIRRHDGNTTRDTVRTLVDEVTALQFVRAHHAQAQPYWPVIDAQIRRRRIAAAHGAFAQGDHALLRRLFADIAPADRGTALRAKAAVAALPPPLDAWTNAALQRLSALAGRGERR